MTSKKPKRDGKRLPHDEGMTVLASQEYPYKGGEVYSLPFSYVPLEGLAGLYYSHSNYGGFMMDLLCSTTLFSTALFAMSFDDFVARAWLAVIFVWLYLVFVTAR